jgi:hypothetical protein
VVKRVVGERVAAPDDLPQQVELVLGSSSNDEERRPVIAGLQGIEDRARVSVVGPVVEGERQLRPRRVHGEQRPGENSGPLPGDTGGDGGAQQTEERP